MAQFIFGEEQLLAIRLAAQWISSLSKMIFVIGGFAGTGKSSVLNQILANMGIPMYKVAFVTYTGKAAVVLRQKGLNAITIHKLIYNVSMGSSGKLSFRKKPRLPSNIELICIDELGMVPNEIMDDLLSYGVPILALGDPGQLPPIFGENKYIVQPDVFLSTVYRNAGDVLRMATYIRNGEDAYNQTYGDDVKIYPFSKFDINLLLTYDQILCSTNANKTILNVKCRELLKFNTPLPQANEKVICVMNNFKDVIPYEGVDMFLVNGLTGITTTEAKQIDENVIYFRFKPDCMNHDIPIYAKKSLFMENYDTFGVKTEDASQTQIMEFYQGKVVNSFNYGYAITTHKSQGSEWNNILVYDDCFYNDDANYRRWLYTSVTRAKKTVSIIRSNL